MLTTRVCNPLQKQYNSNGMIATSSRKPEVSINDRSQGKILIWTKLSIGLLEEGMCNGQAVRMGMVTRFLLSIVASPDTLLCECFGVVAGPRYPVPIDQLKVWINWIQRNATKGEDVPAECIDHGIG